MLPHVHAYFDPVFPLSLRCNGWPWNWDHCVAAGGLWVALNTARGVLWTAQQVVDGFMQGAAAVALGTARLALQTAQGVLSGVRAASPGRPASLLLLVSIESSHH